MSLCSLFFTLLSCSPSFVSIPWVSRVVRSGCVQLRSTGPPDKHHSLVCHPICSHIFISLFFSLFIFTLQLMFFSAFSPSETHFLPPLPIKELAILDWTRKVDFPSNCSSTHFVPLLHRTKPTCCYKTELFVFLPLSSALWLLQCLSFIVNLNPVKFSPCCFSLLLISSCLHFTSVLPCLLSTVLPSTLSFFLMRTTQEGRQSRACRYFLQFKACVAVRRPITGLLS